MAKKQTWKDKLNMAMYENPNMEKKILKIKRSLDEANGVLGGKKKK